MKLFMDDNITDRQNGSGVSDNDVIQVYQNDFDSVKVDELYIYIYISIIIW